MANIPQIVADTEQTRVRQTPMINPSSAGLGSRIEAEGIQNVSASVAKAAQAVSQHLAKIAEKKRAVAEAIEGIDLYNQASAEIEDFSRASEMEHLQRMQTPEATKYLNTYTKSVNDGIKKISEKYIKKGSSDNVIKYLSGRLGTLSIEKNKQAGSFEDKQMLNFSEAVLNTTLQENQRQAITASSDDEAERIVNDGLATVTAVQQQLYPLEPDKLEKMVQKYTDKVFYERARRLQNSDPDAYIDARKQGYLSDRLTPEALRGLDERADRLSTEKAREARIQQEKLERQAEKQAKEAQEIHIANRTKQAMDGTLSLRMLDDDLASGRITKRTDYEHLRDLITKPKEIQTNPALERDIILRLNSTTKPLTESELDGMRSQLKPDDYYKYKSALQANQQRQKSEGNSLLGRQHSQAEELIKKELSVGNAWGEANPLSDELVARGITELTERSSYMGLGREHPLSAAKEIVKAYKPLLGRTAMNKRSLEQALGKYTDANLLQQDIADMPPEQANRFIKLRREYQMMLDKEAEK